MAFGDWMKVDLELKGLVRFRMSSDGTDKAKTSLN